MGLGVAGDKRERKMPKKYDNDKRETKPEDQSHPTLQCQIFLNDYTASLSSRRLLRIFECSL